MRWYLDGSGRCVLVVTGGVDLGVVGCGGLEEGGGGLKWLSGDGWLRCIAPVVLDIVVVVIWV